MFLVQVIAAVAADLPAVKRASQITTKEVANDFILEKGCQT